MHVQFAQREQSFKSSCSDGHICSTIFAFQSSSQNRTALLVLVQLNFVIDLSMNPLGQNVYSGLVEWIQTWTLIHSLPRSRYKLHICHLSFDSPFHVQPSELTWLEIQHLMLHIKSTSCRPTFLDIWSITTFNQAAFESSRECRFWVIWVYPILRLWRGRMSRCWSRDSGFPLKLALKQRLGAGVRFWQWDSQRIVVRRKNVILWFSRGYCGRLAMQIPAVSLKVQFCLPYLRILDVLIALLNLASGSSMVQMKVENQTN